MSGIFLSLSVVVGAALGLFLAPPWQLGALLAGVAIVGVWRGRPSRTVWVSAVVLAVAVARGAWTAPGSHVDPLAGVRGAAVAVGRVESAPGVSGGRSALDVRVSQIEVRGERTDFVQNEPLVRVTLRGLDPSLGRGDEVVVRGSLQQPRSRPGYPYAELLARQGIFHSMEFASVRVSRQAESELLRLLDRVRDSLAATVRAGLEEPQASLTSGVVLGARSTLPADFRSALSVTGTSHIVAVSGYNVAIVAGVVAFVGSRIVGWRLAVVPMIGAVLAYVVMTGLSPSAVRAGLMATLTFLAFAIPGRVPDPLTSLAVACGLIVMVDPLAVMDLGFQLSALATAGIVLFAVSREGGPSRLRSWVLAPLVVSLWAQIATLPIVLSTFHTLSLVSPLANLAIAAIVPGLMVSGCVLALLGAIPWIGGVVAGVTWVFATAIVWIVQGLATVPMAAIYVGAVPLALVAGWYAVLFVWVCVRSADAQAILPRRALVQLAVATTATVVSTSCVWTRQAESASSVTLLDVGAPAAFVRSAEGHTAVIGWSEASAFSLTASVAERFGLFERSLDVLIRTTEPTSGADGTSLLLQRYGATHCLGLGSDATPLSPGTEVVLGDTVIRVVDVRQHEGRAVADVAIVLGDSVVLLPGPGHATPALGDALGGAGSVVVRLPSRAMSWLRELSGVPVAVVVSDGTPTAVRGIDRSTPILTHRNHGSVTVTRDQWDGPFVRVERCTDGQDCGVTRAVSR